MHFKCIVGSFCLSAGSRHSLVSGKYDCHASMSFNFRFAENADLYTAFAKYRFKIIKFDLVGVSFNYNGTRCRASEETDLRDGEAEERSGMERKFAQIL